MKVAVVYNRASQRVVNLLGVPNREKYGKASIDRIVRALKAGGHQVAAFEGDKDLIDGLEDFLPRALRGERPGMVFNLAYGIQGEARYTHVPAILEMIGLPYVGSGPMAHSLALDKVIAKMVFVQHGVPTPEFHVLESPQTPLPADLPWPVIVKPRNEAVSFGIRICHDEAELREAAGAIFEAFDQPVLVERYIEGREINVGLLGNDPFEALPPAEIVFGAGGPRIYTHEDKTRTSGREIGVECPAQLTEAETAAAQDIARRAFRALGCADCARVDMRLDADGNFHVLEINSLPSLGEHGSYVQGAAAIGLDFPALVNRLVEVASARWFGTPHPPALADTGRDPGREAFAFLTARRDRFEARVGEWARISSRFGDPVGQRAAWREADRSLGRLEMRPIEALTDVPEVGVWESPAGLDGGTLLVAQLDVPLGPETAPAAFRRDPEVLWGEGIGASRAPLATLEYVLRALRQVRLLKRAKLGVLLYTEDARGEGDVDARLRAASERASEVLVLRPGTLDDQVVVGRRGARRYRLSVTGELLAPGHGSRRTDPLRWVLGRLDACLELGSGRERTSVSVADVTTRAFPSLLPHEVRATLVTTFPDVRAGDRLEAALRERVGAERGLHSWRLERSADTPPMAETGGNRALAERLAAVAASWEIPLSVDTSRQPSIAGCVHPDTPVLCGLGPATVDPFTGHEGVRRISLVERALLLTQFVIAVAGERR